MTHFAAFRFRYFHSLSGGVISTVLTMFSALSGIRSKTAFGLHFVFSAVAKSPDL